MNLRRVRSGFSLVELVTAIIISSALVLMLGLLVGYANDSLLRSQSAVEQYNDLNSLTRHMEMQIRQADTGEILIQNAGSQVRFRVDGGLFSQRFHSYRYIAGLNPGTSFVQYCADSGAAQPVWRSLIANVSTATFSVNGTQISLQLTQHRHSVGAKHDVLVSTISVGPVVR